LRYRRIIGDFLLKIVEGDVKRAAGQQIRGGIIVTPPGKLLIRGGPGEIREA